jgi:transposase
MRQTKRWNEADIETLVKLKKEGKSYLEISKIFNRTISACQTQIHNIKYRVDTTAEKIRKEERRNKMETNKETNIQDAVFKISIAVIKDEYKKKGTIQ